MDDNLGYQNSWDGFVDYISCYHTVHPLWIATGACIFVGTIIGLIPQIFRIIKLRSSHGISPLSVFVTNINQLFVVLNIFCLHSADFYGMLQISPLRTIPRQLTFANVFILWFAYLPIVFLIFIFYDKSEKLNRTSTSITKEWHITKILSVLLVVFSMILYLIFLFLYLITGSTSHEILSYGKLLGTFSTIVTVCQYIPQFITTCKLKDNGSWWYIKRNFYDDWKQRKLDYVVVNIHCGCSAMAFIGLNHFLQNQTEKK